MAELRTDFADFLAIRPTQYTLPYLMAFRKGKKEFFVNRRKSPNQRPDAQKPRRSSNDNSTEIAGLRIIGGKFRGRKLSYSGDIRTRPMKDRLREAVFNLIGTDIKGARAIDLFAGTGALGLESLSRGASCATFIEQHFPTAAIIERNIASLEMSDCSEVIPGNTFIWFRRKQQENAEKVGGNENRPWVVFCSPPYEFYITRTDEVLELLGGMIAAAPLKSVFAVEADERFDFKLLPMPDAWDVRTYPPAVVGIFRKE
jgi:16S rRNA (guanine966-N2)-methyltransferase